MKNRSQWRAKTKRNYNVISIRKSNVLKYNVILTSSKKLPHQKNKERNYDVIKNTSKC